MYMSGTGQRGLIVREETLSIDRLPITMVNGKLTTQDRTLVTQTLARTEAGLPNPTKKRRRRETPECKADGTFP